MLGTATCCPSYFIRYPSWSPTPDQLDFTSVLELPKSKELCPYHKYNYKKNLKIGLCPRAHVST